MSYFILRHQRAKRVDGGSALKVTVLWLSSPLPLAEVRRGKGHPLPAGTFPYSSTWDFRRFLQNIKSILNSSLTWNYSQPMLLRCPSDNCNHRSFPFPEGPWRPNASTLHLTFGYILRAIIYGRELGRNGQIFSPKPSLLQS